MKTPFPGMDPYLEQKGIWNEIHMDLIADVRRNLVAKVGPNYYVKIEQLNFLSLSSSNGNAADETVGKPDVFVISQPKNLPITSGGTAVMTKTKPMVAILSIPKSHIHRYLTVRWAGNHEVITVIEIISPANKVGHGRKQYLEKRHNVLSSMTNLVEIDLLRKGKPLPMQVTKENHYRILVSRADDRPQTDVYLFSVRQSIPDIPIPLYPEDPEPILSLNEILHDIYVKGYYHRQINYGKPPIPRLLKKDAVWAESMIQNWSDRFSGL
ncbi:MAG: hypothetical protein B6242_09690 [Anaerolineaceae bacterium 4572_78]|nr:MAG: hypothetical protein B6242_09690 [Anaerolineaceae bacterium 4572_78]